MGRRARRGTRWPAVLLTATALTSAALIGGTYLATRPVAVARNATTLSPRAAAGSSEPAAASKLRAVSANR